MFVWRKTIHLAMEISRSSGAHPSVTHLVESPKSIEDVSLIVWSIQLTLFVACRTVITGLRRGMTRHAGTHIVQHLFGDHVALANLAVAGLACCACFSVHTVAEENVRRDPVDADPRNRLLLSGGGSHLLNVRTVSLYRLVAAHAETLRRKPHKFARFSVSVT